MGMFGKMRYFLRRWWALAGAILLLTSPLLYVLSSGPLFLLVRWPGQTGDYALCAQRYTLYREYTYPIEQGLDYADNDTLTEVYQSYLDWWKLPHLYLGTQYPLEEVSTDAIKMGDLFIIIHCSLKEIEPVNDITLKNPWFPPYKDLVKVVYVQEQSLVFVTGPAEYVKHVPHFVSTTSPDKVPMGFHARR